MPQVFSFENTERLPRDFGVRQIFPLNQEEWLKGKIIKLMQLTGAFGALEMSSIEIVLLDIEARP